MALFTRNAWTTGDTITADGLNFAKGVPILTLEYDDWNDGKSRVVFDFDTGITDMTAIELSNLVMKYIRNESGLYELYRPHLVTWEPLDNDNPEDIKLEFNNIDCDCVWYYPATGRMKAI